MFLSMEGGDGTGKSTQAELLCRRLQEYGRRCCLCRDPGSTPLGEAVRELLLHRTETAIGSRAEMLLYMAARAQLVEEIIRPALLGGESVVADRFLLSNVVYQGHAGGLDAEELWQIGLVAVERLLPDLVIVLDLPVETALARIPGTPDRLESRGAEYHHRVREGFLQEARRLGDRAVIVSAEGPVEAVHEAVWQAVAPHLEDT